MNTLKFSRIQPLYLKELRKERRKLGRIAQKIANGIAAQRDEVARAFIAQYGCRPDEICQMVQILPGGVTKWWLEYNGPPSTRREPL